VTLWETQVNFSAAHLFLLWYYHMPVTTTLSTKPDGNNQGRQPDISYAPDRERWTTRTTQRLAEDPTLLSIPLPEGFPRKLDSPLVWEGKDWKDESQWVYNLSPAELKEIDEAVRHFHGRLTHTTVNFCSADIE
jgi:hypothetical protein